MSFSSNVKSEILNIFNNTNSNITELLVIISYCGKYDNSILTISSENILLITKTLRLIEKVHNIHLDIIVENTKAYKLITENQIYINKIFKVIGLNNNININNLEYNSLTFSDISSIRAYIRACFICGGYISNPEKNYHLEFTSHTRNQAYFIKSLLEDNFNISPKIIEKKEKKQKKHNFIVYIKESEQISELLNIIEAHKALMEFENIRILKEVRNNVNRTVNCETANLNKVILASVSHIQDIEYIKLHIGLENLPQQLNEIAMLRLDNPDASLNELSLLTRPHIGKSGVNHRLKKLNSIAENLRRKNI